MATTPSTIFAHFESEPRVEWARHEVASAALGRIRAGMRHLIEALDADESDPAPAAMLRNQLFIWLTRPAPFSEDESAVFRRLGSAEQIRQRWGDDVLRSCLRIARAFLELTKAESPLRVVLEQVVSRASESDDSFAIFCRRHAVLDFRTIAVVERLEREGRLVFLHSASDYRDADPFHVLIHVGPFRISSYSSVPPAVLNSPRYRRLLQFSWEGLSDESGCADDPVVCALQHDDQVTANALSTNLGTTHSSSLSRSVEMHSGPDSIDADSTESMIDEIAVLQTARVPRVDTAQAIMLHVSDELSIPYASHSMVTLLLGEGQLMTIETVMAANVPAGRVFLVWHDIGDVDIGGSRAHDGRLSTEWKARLRQEVERDSFGLERRLRAAGLELDTLHGCLRNWIEPATTVIHAPQQRRHFEILISVIGVQSNGRPVHTQWWRVAWKEIAESRGEAIQVGMQEQDIIAEERQRILAKRLPELRITAEAGDTFRFRIPHDESLEGTFTLYRLAGVERGFRVPRQRLEMITPLTETEAWRV